LRERLEAELSHRVLRAGAVFVVALSLSLASCQDSVEPPIASAFETVSEIQQAAVAGSPVASAPAVRVLDQRGDPLPGVRVEFAIVEGGGSVTSSAAVTDRDGNATAGRWTLGPRAGRNAIRASATALPPVLFSADGRSGPPALVIGVAGDAQTGPAGSVLPVPVTVRVTDSNGNAVEGAEVRFRLAPGSDATVSDLTATDVAGLATARWTLGTRSGIETLTVTVAGAGDVVFNASVGAAEPAVVTMLEGDGQSALVATPVPVRPVVRVQDAFGNVTPGVEVRFEILAGDGAVVGSLGSGDVAVSMADSLGIARASHWLLGTRAGPNRLRAVVGTAEAVFSATGEAGEPVTIEIHDGDGQSAPAGTSVPIPPSVRVLDAFANPVSGVTVGFSIGAGGGTVIGAAKETDTAGIATVDAWTLGPVGANTLLASLAGVANVSFSATATAGSGGTGGTGGSGGGGGGSGSGGSPGYYIDMRLSGNLTASQQAEFFGAAGRWASVITGDLPDVTVSIPADACGITHGAVNETIDDLLILVSVVPIDGPGNVLGSAGPCYVRSSGGLTLVGAVRLDEADVAYLESNGRLSDVIAHELGHVVGIGTRWGGLLVGAGGADPTFSGTSAVTEFLSAGGSSYAGQPVPVENLGGPGTRDGHWRESVFRNELMTGWLDLSGNPLSTITVAALADIGYVVDFNGSDGFSVSSASAASNDVTASLPRLELREGTLPIQPTAVDERGRPVARGSVIR